MGPELTTLRPEQVRLKMRKYLAKGVDFVKVATSAHRISWASPGEPLMFSPEVLKAMAEEVHAAGKIIESHQSTPESIRLTVEAGFDLLQHPRLEDDDLDLIPLIIKNNVFCAILTPKNSGRKYPIIPPPGIPSRRRSRAQPLH